MTSPLYKVAAKVATTTGGYGWSRVEQFMINEAQTYCALPEWTLEDMYAYGIVPPLAKPQKLCAIVPKFYGLYVRADDIRRSLERQVDKRAKQDNESAMECLERLCARKAEDEDAALQWTFSRLRQPIMIMEDCGKPICPR
ncbi:hypothetical protein EXIGLDRAFT_725626 [Exidia glandulosa HHB12029]|uniref:Uncharacterized protein n=1 Tax=Exidia glandulosa HHB12029 TaxID=1314781 RepID=A0A165Q6J6_EXIGL|nr:hypothetical protein EXIGLDRAFT_725626 [Exidia glandulosa HHB12029]